jgi:hypothetical protein
MFFFSVFGGVINLRGGGEGVLCLLAMFEKFL